jgi:hypothetical protein
LAPWVGWGFKLGYSTGFQRGGIPDLWTVRIERELSLRGAVKVLDLAPGLWAKACLFGLGEDWGEAPISRFGKPPWMFDEAHVTLILADAVGRTNTILLPWAEHASGTANCVPVAKGTRLMGSEDRPWLLHFEQG